MRISDWSSDVCSSDLQAKAYYEAAKSQTIAAQNALNDAREALTQITGKPTGDLKKLRDDLPMQAPVPADQDSWVKQALQTNPNLLAQQKNVDTARSEEHTSELQSLMRSSYAVFCLNK